MNFKQTWRIVCHKLLYTHYRTSAYAMQHIYAEQLPNVRRARFWSAVKSECEIWLAEDCEWRQAFAHCILIVKWCNVAPDCSWQSLWWPTTVTTKPKTSRQNRKPHGKTKNLTAKTKYLTAKPKTSRQKQNTSRQNQKPHGKTKYSLRSRRLEVMGERENGRAWGRHASPRVSPSRAPVFSCAHHFQAPATQAKPNTSQQKQNSFGFDVGVCFWGEVFGFCCEVFGFAVRSLVLPWEFWFCREVFCFWREVFGFAVRYFVFAVTVVGHRTKQIEARHMILRPSETLLEEYNSGTPNK